MHGSHISICCTIIPTQSTTIQTQTWHHLPTATLMHLSLFQNQMVKLVDQVEEVTILRRHSSGNIRNTWGSRFIITSFETCQLILCCFTLLEICEKTCHRASWPDKELHESEGLSYSCCPKTGMFSSIHIHLYLKNYCRPRISFLSFMSTWAYGLLQIWLG